MDENDIVTVNVGKNGVSTELIKELSDILKKYKRCRVKMLKSALNSKDKKEVTEDIRIRCKCRQAKLIGHTITLKR